jgi:hypothetical protein
VAALIVGTWLWGDKYPVRYVDRLRAGVARHLKQPYRFDVWRPQPEDEYLTIMRGCFARLRVFDPAWQQHAGIETGDRVVCLDLDSVVTGGLDPLFDRDDPFVVLTGANASNPCPYNGSVWMLRAGHRPDVWHDFSLEAAARVPFYQFPDDQAWMAHKLPGVAGWPAGPASGVYAFKKPGWPKGDALPADARLVVFPGWRDPQKFTHLPWIKEHWR